MAEKNPKQLKSHSVFSNLAQLRGLEMTAADKATYKELVLFLFQNLLLTASIDRFSQRICVQISHSHQLFFKKCIILSFSIERFIGSKLIFFGFIHLAIKSSFKHIIPTMCDTWARAMVLPTGCALL